MKRISVKLYALITFVMITVFYCQNSMAADHIIHYFQPSKHDLSEGYLQLLFGQVGNVLHGVKLNPIGTMFREFNEAVLVLGAIIVIYTTIMSIINTAHQGEFLGKKLDSLWVPLRTVAGIVLLVPGATGYSVIQIFMMWVIIQGVGAADTLWGVTIKAFSDLGAGQQQMEKSEALNDIVPIRDILTGFVKVHEDYRSLHPKTKFDDLVLIRDSSPFYQHDKKEGYAFSGLFDGVYYNVKRAPATGVDYIGAKQYVLFTDMPSVLKQLNEYARNIAYTGLKPALPNPILAYQDSLSRNIAKVVDNLYKAQKSNSKWQTKASDYGWMTAGAYYYKLATAGVGSPPDDTAYSFASDIDNSRLRTKDISVQSTKIINQLFNDASTQIKKEAGGTVLPNPNFDFNTKDNSKSLKAIILFVASNVAGKLVDMYNQGSHDETSIMRHDPLQQLHAIGQNLLTTTYWAWGITLTLIGALSFAAGFCSAQSPGGLIFTSLFLTVLPPLLILEGAIFLAGITLGVYVPMIPYIIFSIASIGWVIAVVETMIAAPLVALGITHPEGHEVYGRAEPAIQLLTNVFFRPSLMIFGLGAGMLVARVIVGLINTLFSMVINTNTVGAGSNGDVVLGIVSLVIYVALIVGLVNRSFSLIHIIPDRVLAWIGNQAQFGRYAEGIEEGVKGAAAQAGQTLKQTGDSYSSEVRQGSEKMGGATKRWLKGGKPKPKPDNIKIKGQ